MAGLPSEMFEDDVHRGYQNSNTRKKKHGVEEITGEDGSGDEEGKPRPKGNRRVTRSRSPAKAPPLDDDEDVDADEER